MKKQSLLTILALSLSLSLAACGGSPKIDASSQAKFEASMVKVMDSLSGDKKVEFEAAIGKLMSQFMMEAVGAAMTGQEMSDADLEKALLDKFDGKTAAQIIKMAE